MTYNEIWEQFIKLSPNDQGRFLDSANQLVKFNNTGLLAGAKVCFKNSKTGATIVGNFVRMKQKYAEIETMQDKFGIDRGVRMTWSVPPQMLRMVNG